MLRRILERNKSSERVPLSRVVEVVLREAIVCGEAFARKELLRAADDSVSSRCHVIVSRVVLGAECVIYRHDVAIRFRVVRAFSKNALWSTLDV